jgi:hypothetical protein
MRRRDQRARDADIFFVADETIGIVDMEREAEQRRDRPECDVTLFPGDAQTEHAFAIVLAHADNAVVGNGGGIGARVRIRQCEARDFESLRETRQ